MANASDPAEWFGEAEFIFEGEPFKLTFDNMALLEAEGVLGKSLMDWLPDLHARIKTGANPLLQHLAALVYGGLKQNHEAITEKQVVSMVMAKDPGLRDAIVKALASIEIPEEALAEVGNVPAAPVGNRQQRRAAAKKA